jgi:radical SAM protein (TIGR01212 family)
MQSRSKNLVPVQYIGKRYNAYSNFIRSRYGQRVQKVTVDAGFTCPNRDGTVAKGGCTYCNNASFNPPYNDASKSIRQQVLEGVDFLKKRYGVDKFIVYFQPYSNTYASLELLKNLYGQALEIENVVGLTVGTRPDCVDLEKIRYLEDLSKTHDITIEYGLESMRDDTLRKINRGHDYQTYLDAVHLTANRNIQICTHIILGFPWENNDHWYHQAQILSSLPIDFLKIHHLHIVKDTAMAEQYKKEPFHVFSYPEFVETVISMIELISPKLILQRLAGEAAPGILIAPRWNMTYPEVLQGIESEMERKNTWQGKKYKAISEMAV